MYFIITPEIIGRRKNFGRDAFCRVSLFYYKMEQSVYSRCLLAITNGPKNETQITQFFFHNVMRLTRHQFSQGFPCRALETRLDWATNEGTPSIFGRTNGTSAPLESQLPAQCHEETQPVCTLQTYAARRHGDSEFQIQSLPLRVTSYYTTRYG